MNPATDSPLFMRVLLLKGLSCLPTLPMSYFASPCLPCPICSILPYPALFCPALACLTLLCSVAYFLLTSALVWTKPMQQNDTGPILLFLWLCIRKSTQGLLRPIVWHITTNLFVWHNSKKSAGKVVRPREMLSQQATAQFPLRWKKGSGGLCLGTGAFFFFQSSRQQAKFFFSRC